MNTSTPVKVDPSIEVDQGTQAMTSDTPDANAQTTAAGMPRKGHEMTDKPEWQPISEYRGEPGEVVMFRFQPVDSGSNKLSEMFSTERSRGFRVCTHFYRLPPLKAAT